jgi:Family of unknown function (DUF5677)
MIQFIKFKKPLLMALLLALVILEGAVLEGFLPYKWQHAIHRQSERLFPSERYDPHPDMGWEFELDSRQHPSHRAALYGVLAILAIGDAYLILKVWKALGRSRYSARRKPAKEQTMESLGERVLGLAQKIVDLKSDSPHMQAVQAYCAFEIEILRGILDLAAVGNGAAAQSLVRTLFEGIVGIAVLAKNPSTLQDFEKHGKLTTLRLAQNMPSASPFSGKAKEFITKEGVDYAALFKYFEDKKFKWHPFSQTKAYEQAELPDNFNNRFYARSSAISHSEPFVVLEPPRSDPYWKIQPRPEEWERWAGLSQTMSLLFTIHMIDVVSRTLGLGLDSEVAKLSAEVDTIAKAEMKPVIERLSK